MTIHSKGALRRGLLKTSTVFGVALTGVALPMAAMVAAGLSLAPLEASAQDYTSGALLGSVSDASGKPLAGATVTLTSTALGQTRTLTTNESGGFSATGLQPGAYDISISANGYDTYKASVAVVVSQEVRVNAALQQTGAPQTIVVKAHRVRQDFTKTTTGLTVDMDTLVQTQPVARNVTAVSMLAPTVVLGNPGFGNVASFGGGSVAENAYYIDGLNITNPDTYVGSSSVPFYFYKTVEVKTGGYPAEFGRATGGVVNATTKSGTNDFMFAVHGDYQPMDLESDPLNTYANRGKYSKTQNNSLAFEMGGPLIKDRLFAYGLYQINDYEQTGAAYRTGVYQDLRNNSPFMGFKLDGYITPTQHLSLTYFDTSNVNKSNLYSFSDSSTALNPTGDTETIGDKTGTSSEAFGGKSWVLNYNGKVTDWFSISAAYGDTKSRDDLLPSDTASYYVQSYYDGTGAYTGALQTTSLNQPSSALSQDDVERKFWRADGDIRFDALGHHHIRFGYDHEENSMIKIDTLTGSVPVGYEFSPNPDDNSSNPEELLLVTYEHLGGSVSAKNSATYIQDSWDITQNFNVQIGLRNDDFTQNNLSGQQ
jgi:outer membrane receptor for ferrienterochelin and colicin